MAEDDLEDEEVFTDYDEEVCRMTAQPKRQLNKGRGPFYGQCLLYTHRALPLRFLALPALLGIGAKK